MRLLLLDTQVMLWWLVGDSRLRATTRELIGRTACVVSESSDEHWDGYGIELVRP